MLSEDMPEPGKLKLTHKDCLNKGGEPVTSTMGCCALCKNLADKKKLLGWKHMNMIEID